MTPRFESVPEHWKYPEGPYRQAPPEYGGEWWMVNPFATPEPWLTQSQPVRRDPLPEGFEELFGPRPEASSFRSTPNPSQYFRMALVNWEQELRYFQKPGPPDWASEDALRNAAAIFEAWEMGSPRYYLGRYGWAVRFRDSALPDFDAEARAALESTHLLVARFQMAMLEHGLMPARKHPFVPPLAWPDQNHDFEEGTNATD